MNLNIPDFSAGFVVGVVCGLIIAYCLGGYFVYREKQKHIQANHKRWGREANRRQKKDY